VPRDLQEGRRGLLGRYDLLHDYHQKASRVFLFHTTNVQEGHYVPVENLKVRGQDYPIPEGYEAAPAGLPNKRN